MRKYCDFCLFIVSVSLAAFGVHYAVVGGNIFLGSWIVICNLATMHMLIR